MYKTGAVVIEVSGVGRVIGNALLKREGTRTWMQPVDPSLSGVVTLTRSWRALVLCAAPLDLSLHFLPRDRGHYFIEMPSTVGFRPGLT